MFHRFELENWQSDYEQTVRFNLSDSTIEPVRLRELLTGSADLDELLDTALYYPEVNGERALRTVIAALYETPVDPDDVLVTVGASEANAAVVETLCGPGDRVVVMEPGYRQVWGMALNNGCGVRGFPLNYSQGWAPDLDVLAGAAVEGTRMIYICNPNNPTGYILTEAEMDRVVEIAEQCGAWLLADEVYQGSERAPDRRTRSFAGRTEKLIVVNSMSKTYGLSGLRIGWVIAPRTLVAELWRRHEYFAIATGRLDNTLARMALTEPVRTKILTRNRLSLDRGWEVLASWLDENAGIVSLPEPEATGLGFLKYHADATSIEVGHAIRQDASVLVCPGTFFGLDGHLRLNFGFGAAYVEQALRSMTPVLQALDRGSAPVPGHNAAPEASR